MRGRLEKSVAAYREGLSEPEEGSAQDSVASDLGIGPKGQKHLATIATAYGVKQRAVGDKAAKASELCLGGVDKVSANPKLALRKVEGALEFGAKTVKDLREVDAFDESLLPLDDLFVPYVTMDCPDPSRR